MILNLRLDIDENMIFPAKKQILSRIRIRTPRTCGNNERRLVRFLLNVLRSAELTVHILQVALQ
jgi:hypothetical protein